MADIEEWRPVLGYEGLYEVSNFGKVKSLPRKGTKGGILATAKRNKKYNHLTVTLTSNNSTKYPFVHKLVLEAFVGLRPEGMECCHGDGDPTNNHLSNLRWDTPSKNTYDSIAHGTHPQSKKDHCPQGHPLEQYNLTPSMLKKGYRQCLSCNRARSLMKSNKRVNMSLDKLSDIYHERAKEEATRRA